MKFFSIQFKPTGRLCFFLLLFLVPTFYLSSDEIEEQTSIRNSRDLEVQKSNWGKPLPPDSPNPRAAAFLGIIPGLGQAYLGNPGTAGFQMGLFLGINRTRSYMVHQPDYIKLKDRNVDFDLFDAYLGTSLQRNNSVYTDLPLISETQYDRTLRLFSNKAIAELNPYIKYGPYERTNKSSFVADNLSNPELSVILYSVYSSYRDAGGLGEYKKSETIEDLALAPFQFSVLKSYFVYVPIVAMAAIAGVSSRSYSGDNPILVPESLRRDGSLQAGAFLTGISPAIGEEAFFRGYVNYNMTMRLGALPGLGTSSLLFMLAHEGNTDAADGRLSRLAMGLYLGYVHMKFGYDIRPTVAIHFWYNFLIGLSELVRYKSDPNFDKSQREVFYMPFSYTHKF